MIFGQILTASCKTQVDNQLVGKIAFSRAPLNTRRAIETEKTQTSLSINQSSEPTHILNIRKEERYLFNW